jgi:hypothetical protein
MSDFQISAHGSIISIKPLSAAARTWVGDPVCPGPPTKVVRLLVPIAEFARKLALK